MNTSKTKKPLEEARYRKFSLMLIISILFLSNTLSALGGTEIQDRQSFVNISSIEIIVPDWDVELTRGSEDSTVDLEIKPYDENTYDVSISQRADRLYIEVNAKPVLGILSSRYPGMMVSLPENMDIYVTSSSGDIRLETRVTGLIQLNTASGSVRAANPTGRINIETSSGDIRLDGFSGELQAETSSGDIRIDGGEGLLSLASSSGSIELRSSVAAIEAKNLSGDIRLYDFRVFDFARFTTNSGDVSLEVLGDPEDFSFFTRTNSGDIRIFNQSGNEILEAGSGAIPVTIVTGSGDIRIF